MAYNSQRRSPRGYKRVVRAGSERFDVDGVGLEVDGSDSDVPGSKQSEDDSRILRELPPHWGIFSERDR
jgi:hypothetical protein